MDKETIELLFRRHYPRMYRLARVLLKDDAAGKDVVSDVFADVLDGKAKACTESYLLVCVRNKCLNLLSRQKMRDRVHRLLQADASPTIAPAEATASVMGEMAREADRREAILAYMDAALTPQTRKVLDLRFHQKLKYREIATELGISEVAVYKHLAQGIKQLKERFNP